MGAGCQRGKLHKSASSVRSAGCGTPQRRLISNSASPSLGLRQLLSSKRPRSLRSANFIHALTLFIPSLFSHSLLSDGTRSTHARWVLMPTTLQTPIPSRLFCPPYRRPFHSVPFPRTPPTRELTDSFSCLRPACPTRIQLLSLV